MSGRLPLVSVIVPAYQAEDTVGACITGALSQTYPNVEVVVVDDGSTDRTEQICRAYGSRIRFARQANAGSAAARNKAFSLAEGDFFAFCDADDVLLPAYVESALDAYRREGGGSVIVMSDALQLTTTGLAHGRRLIGSHFPRRRQRMAILQKNFVPILSLFPRSLLEDVPGFSEDLMLVEDWDFWIRAILSGWRVSYQPVPQALYRLSPAAKSSDDRRHAAEDTIIRRVRDEYWSSLTAAERAFVTRRLQAEPPRYIDLRAGEALRARRYRDAARLYRELSVLSSEDPRVRLRALLLGYVPGAMRLGRRRQESIDRRMGGRLPDVQAGPAAHPRPQENDPDA